MRRISHLQELEKKYKPERIIIEYNGMWNFKNMKLPWYFTVEQQITIIDASTFPMYYTNMKSLLAEMLRKSEMIIFNRCDGIEDLSSYKRNVKAINQQADIICPISWMHRSLSWIMKVTVSGIWIPLIIWIVILERPSSL